MLLGGRSTVFQSSNLKTGRINRTRNDIKYENTKSLNQSGEFQSVNKRFRIESKFYCTDTKERPFKDKKGFFFDANGILYGRDFKKLSGIRDYLITKGCKKETFPTEEECQEKLKDLKMKAGKGGVTREEYYEALIRAHNVTEPQIIKDGVAFMQKEMSTITPFPDVATTLSTLKQHGKKLGVITNSMSTKAQKLEWFKEVGLPTSWDGYVSSAEIGEKKPHPSIYTACLEEAGVAIQDAVFVGHSGAELEGAKSLGITTCSFNADLGAKGDYDIGDQFSLLLKMI